MKRYGETIIRTLEEKNVELSQRAVESDARASWLRTIINADPCSVMVMSADATVQHINPAGMELLQARLPGDIAGRKLTEFSVEEHREALGACIQAVWRGDAKQLEFEVTGLDGGRRSVEMHAVPLRDVRGNVAGVLGIARDNSQRKELSVAWPARMVA